MPSRFRLYETCVQSPADLVGLLVAIHGGAPVTLGEDFCGTAALSAAWVKGVRHGRAIAVDADPEPLAHAPHRSDIRLVEGDVVRDTDPSAHGCDLVYAGNFSIGERRTRPDLLAYLRHARSRLSAGGLFVCDVYGGESAYRTGTVERDNPLPGGGVVRYTWEQREADPISGMVVNALHFGLLADGTVREELRDAFVYRWRLWSLPELRDAMLETGLGVPSVFAKTPDAVDDAGRVYPRRIEGAADLDEDFDVLVAARRD